jgi:signal transduction histidine kinase
MDNIRVKWHRSLNTQVLLGVGILSASLMAGWLWAINTDGKQLVFAESSRLIQSTGDNAVADLSNRSREIAALTRTLGQTASQLPKQEALFFEVLPKVIDFQGDQDVAGGGYWPEPFTFQANRDRRSFFWGRDQQGTLQYFDDYNRNGYHRADWYVVGRYLQPGDCFWSRSYVDPYSLEPMVTCTVANYTGSRFTGVTTIDLRLSGLQDFAESWQRKTGGYIFIVDRDNKFLTFPKAPFVKQTRTDSQGKTVAEFLNAQDLAQKETLFNPIAQALAAQNQTLLNLAKSQPDFRPEITAQLTQQSDDISADEANIMAAVLSDPLAGQTTNLIQTVSLPSDWLLQTPSTAYIFHVPGSYWRLVIVKPVSEATMVASSIARVLTERSVVIVFMIGLSTLLVARYLLIRPIRKLQVAAEAIAHPGQEFNKTEWYQALPRGDDEMGALGYAFRSMADQLQVSFQKLQTSNRELETTLEELRQTQVQLIQNEKMSALGQLIGGIAHEISNPVNFIYGNLRHLESYTQDILHLLLLCQKELQPLPPGIAAEIEQVDLPFLIEDLPRSLSSMQIGAERIRQLIVSLRYFSRHDDPETKLVNIHELLDSTLLILQGQLKSTPYRPAITVTQNYSPKLPMLECYPGPLHQVFLNLINSAIASVDQKAKQNNYTQNQRSYAQILIETRLIGESDQIEVLIQDNGVGLSAEDLNQAIDPFTSGKSPEARKLGLYISYQIITEKHSGTWQAKPIATGGTEFRLTLPTRQSQVDNSHNIQPHPTEAKAKKVRTTERDVNLTL